MASIFGVGAWLRRSRGSGRTTLPKAPEFFGGFRIESTRCLVASAFRRGSSMRPSAKKSDRGLTLLEVAVVFVVIGVLMALVIPAVIVERGPARRTWCSTQQRNLALALIQFHDQHDVFPGWATRYGEYSPDRRRDGETFDRAHPKVGTWAVGLLPYLEAQPTYERWTQDRMSVLTLGEHGVVNYHPDAAPIHPIFVCSSDYNEDGPGTNSYVVNVGLAFPMTADPASTIDVEIDGRVTAMDFAASMSPACGVIGNAWDSVDADGRAVSTSPRTRLDDLTGGQGFTLVTAESLHAGPWHRVGFGEAADWLIEDAGRTYAPECRYTTGVAWGTEALERQPNFPVTVDPFGNAASNPANVVEFSRPSSAHVEGFNASFADGATRFIRNSIDADVYRALLTPGTDPIGDALLD